MTYYKIKEEFDGHTTRRGYSGAPILTLTGGELFTLAECAKYGIRLSMVSEIITADPDHVKIVDDSRYIDDSKYDEV